MSISRRLEVNPIINASPEIGDVVNHPSVISVPTWVEDPLGEYYLYFSHKHGKYIRLAYADRIDGPWELYEPGTLQIEQTPFVGHIASPDVHVDHDAQEIRMYYHGETRVRDLVTGTESQSAYRRDHYGFKTRSIPHRIAFETGRFVINSYYRFAGTKRSGRPNDGSSSLGKRASESASETTRFSLKNALRRTVPVPFAVQETRQAVSSDGLTFTNDSPILGPSWFAVFSYNDRYFALGRDGYLYVSSGPAGPFERRRQLFDDHRHFGVYVTDAELEVYYSRPTDEPERIVRTTIALDQDVNNWRLGEAVDVIAPEKEYEGSEIKVDESKDRRPAERRCELRDPEIVVAEGTKYLFYTLAGESGIGVAELLD